MSDGHEAPRAAEDAEPMTTAHDRLRSAQDAAIMELQRRHELIAAELARLSAILEAAGRPAGEMDDGGETASRWGGALQRSPSTQPDHQRVIHLGTERTPAYAPRRSLAIALSAGAVGAVVAAAVTLLLLGPRGVQPRAGFAETVGEAASEPPSLDAVAPSTAVPLQPGPPSATLDAVLARARTSSDLGDETAALVRRLPALTALDGAARSEEAADIYGLAVTAARTDRTGVAADIATALEPEVTVDSVLTLAQRRPDVVGAGVIPLLDQLARLPTLPAEARQEEAQALMDAVAEGVAAETISDPFRNSIARPLVEYGATMPPA